MTSTGGYIATRDRVEQLVSGISVVVENLVLMNQHIEMLMSAISFHS